MKKTIILGTALATVFASCDVSEEQRNAAHEHCGSSYIGEAHLPEHLVNSFQNGIAALLSAAGVSALWANVAESTADLGEFSYITAPNGTVVDNESVNTYTEEAGKLKMLNKKSDASFYVSGPTDFKAYKMAEADAEWDQAAFDANITEQLTALGAVPVYSGPLNLAEEKTTVPDVEGNNVSMWLLKQGDKMIAFQVSGNNIAVVEEKAAVVHHEEAKDATEMYDQITKTGAALLHINFNVGKAAIKHESDAIVSEISKMMKANPSLNISVEGHTDKTGNEASNVKLSKSRAEAVKANLIEQGIDASRLDAKGFGSSAPIATNETEEGRAENRRVELKKM